MSDSRHSAPNSGTRLPVHGLTRLELGERLAAAGFSPVHAARLWSYLYWECAESWEAMEELPARVRAYCKNEYELAGLAVTAERFSSDGHTRKFLLGLADGRRVESVLMRFTGRATACLSSQVGCAMGCSFCATGHMGFQRHLTAAEIVGQALHLQRLLRRGEAGLVEPARTPRGGEPSSQAGASAGRRSANPAELDPAAARLRNVVLMGMGEPLHNYEAVMRAIDILRDQSGFALASSRITLSTVGVVPGILRMAEERRPPHLAVSLHAATQEERERLVPVARRWPLDELIAACRTYCERLGRRIFFEWTLIEGKNDGEEQAHAVGRLLAGLPAQVNLIPLNPTEGYEGRPTGHAAARRFQQVLAGYSLPSTLRQRRGIDIAAGCGQLAAPTE